MAQQVLNEFLLFALIMIFFAIYGRLAARFSHYAVCLFVFPQPHKLRMPQVTIRRPFSELILCDQLRFEPHTFFILCLASLSKKQVVAVF
jgi:hypothetical protein